MGTPRNGLLQSEDGATSANGKPKVVATVRGSLFIEKYLLAENGALISTPKMAMHLVQTRLVPSLWASESFGRLSLQPLHGVSSENHT